MDPFTITSSVLRITGSCIGAAKTLWEIRSAWKRAPVTVSSLCSQLKLTAASLSQIQSLLLKDTDVLREKPELVETFDTTLTSCLTISTWLDKIMQKINKGVLDGDKTTWKIRFKTLWNENDVDELLKLLHTQQGAMSVLVGLLQMDSLSEIRRLVRRHDALLQQIADNTRALRRGHAIDAPESILATDGNSESMFSQIVHRTKHHDEEPSFESEVLNSKVYSKAITGVLIPTADDQFDDARTIVDTKFPAALSTANAVSVPTDMRADVAELAVYPMQIKFSMQKLGITEIFAGTWSDHTARSPEELTYKSMQGISSVKKLTASRYRGQLGDANGTPGGEGVVDRNNVMLWYYLHQPLAVCTSHRSLSEAFNSEYDLTYREGEMLNIEKIIHGICWWATSQERRRGRENQSGYVWVCDSELAVACKQYIDRLLSFFSCPLPALVSLDKHERYIQMRKMTNELNPSIVLKVIAHCNSFEDLQFVASVRKEIVESWRTQGAG